MDTILKINHLTTAYDGRAALEDISLEIPARRITAILGPSGCGKSTLLHSINGMVEEVPNAKVTGEIFLNGQNIRKIPTEELRRRIGLVFQIPAPFPFSIYKNMTYAPIYYGIKDKKKLDELVKEKLQLAGLYEEVKDDLNRSAGKLSGGQQQRLCIARALTVEPEVLLLDEPCSALDVKSTAAIENMLLELKKSYTIVLVTHNIQQAKRISDRAVFLYNGRLIEAADTGQLFASPKAEETRDFLSGNFG
ncbi:MAG: phosphate ABC transporter ATP-binding protein [Lachnospiraceae bacterium]|nr:phosphate ABC transporter ATP-binding protein [Lachnospiraceae bacterium]